MNDVIGSCPDGCQCDERWRHEVAAAAARRERQRQVRAELDRARRHGVARRNAARLRRARDE